MKNSRSKSRIQVKSSISKVNEKNKCTLKKTNKSLTNTHRAQSTIKNRNKFVIIVAALCITIIFGTLAYNGVFSINKKQEEIVITEGTPDFEIKESLEGFYLNDMEEYYKNMQQKLTNELTQKMDLKNEKNTLLREYRAKLSSGLKNDDLETIPFPEFPEVDLTIEQFSDCRRRELTDKIASQHIKIARKYLTEEEMDDLYAKKGNPKEIIAYFNNLKSSKNEKYAKELETVNRLVEKAHLRIEMHVYTIFYQSEGRSTPNHLKERWKNNRPDNLVIYSNGICNYIANQRGKISAQTMIDAAACSKLFTEICYEKYKQTETKLRSMK